MNIKNIERTLLFDNINSSVLKSYKDNWNKDTNKELELYSVYRDYFENENEYLVYLGITDKNEHYFSKITLPSNSHYSNEYRLNVTNIKLINNNLLALSINSVSSTILYKKINCTKEEEDKIFNIIKNQYDETPNINSLNIGSVKFNTVGATSWVSLYENVNINELANDVKDLKAEIKELKKQLKKISKKTP